MATKLIGAVEIATEGSFGSIGTGGVPDGTGLGAYVSMEIADLAQIIPIGDPLQIDRNGPRCGRYFTAPEPVRADPDGQVIRRAQTTIDFWLRPRGEGATFATYPDMPAYRLLRTRWETLEAALNEMDRVAVGTATDNTWTPTAPTDFDVGQMVRKSSGSLAQYSAVTCADVTTPLITVSPAFAAAPVPGEAVYPLTTLFVPRCGGDPDTLETVALRLTGDGWVATCYGCYMTAMTITGVSDATRGWRVSATVQCDWVEYSTTASAPPVFIQADGQIVHSLAAGVVQSVDFESLTAPAALAREFTPCADEWTLTLTWAMGQSQCDLSWLGLAKAEAVDLDATLEIITGAYEPDYSADYAGRLFRNTLVGGSAYDGAAGEGACIFLPAAVLMEDPIKPDVGKDYLRTALRLKPGYYAGDGATTRIGNSLIRLGLG